MLQFSRGLRATCLATLVALAGVSAISAPVAATGPIPPAPTPTAAVSPSPSPSSTPAPAPAAKPDLGARVARIALAQRSKRYVFGAVGPWAFDCSGLVRYSYRRAGVTRYLGGLSARGIYLWARMRGLISRSNPRVGDVVVYGRGSHVAIYIGHGRVISALNPRQGIRITALRAVGVPFTGFIHPRF